MMRRLLILLPLVLLLAGCKTSLFEGLDEDQANRIIAVLSHSGITGVKERNADKTWTVSVDDADAVAATELAGAYALPRGGHTNLGELFSRQGLISSPEEDHVRYVYGLTQELAETLEKIDGILVARVHIVDPERDPLSGPAAPATASVMLRYRSDYNLEPMRDRIRELVSGAVEGLAPERVYITLIPVLPIVTASDACGRANLCPPKATDTPQRSTVILVVLTTLGMLLFLFVWIWDAGFRSVSDMRGHLPTLFRRRGKRNRKAAIASVPSAPTGDSKEPGNGDTRNDRMES